MQSFKRHQWRSFCKGHDFSLRTPSTIFQKMLYYCNTYHQGLPLSAASLLTLLSQIRVAKSLKVWQLTIIASVYYVPQTILVLQQLFGFERVKATIVVVRVLMAGKMLYAYVNLILISRPKIVHNINFCTTAILIL